MHRGVALIDWRSGLLAYVEADDAALGEFRKVVELCGGALEPRSLPCMTSLASRLEIRSVLYITDVYGIANSVAFEKKTARAPLLEKAWGYIDSLICGGGRGGMRRRGGAELLQAVRPCLPAGEGVGARKGGG